MRAVCLPSAPAPHSTTTMHPALLQIAVRTCREAADWLEEIHFYLWRREEAEHWERAARALQLEEVPAAAARQVGGGWEGLLLGRMGRCRRGMVCWVGEGRET